MANRFTKMFGSQDMTVGSPAKNIIKFSVPLLIGNVAQLLYSTVDSIVVGQYVGDGALAAIGVCMPIINLMLVLFMGIAVGSSIMVAQFFGAKDKDKLSRTVGSTMTLSLLASVLITVVGVLISAPILSLTSTPADVFPMANEYLVITFIAMIGPVFYNMISGILRGMGDSIMPLVFLLVACGLNIVLDIWFVAGFGWGVAGVAWATAISQIVSAALCVIKLLSLRGEITLNRKTLKLDKKLSWQLLKLGLPSGLTQGIFSVTMLVVQSLTNSFGTVFVAMSTVVMRVDGFAMIPNFSFGNTMTTYAGQNIGAGRLDRVKEGTKRGMQIAVGTSVVLTTILIFFGQYLITMFTDTPEVMVNGTRVIRILAIGYVAICVTQVLQGVMRGAGETVVPMWISIVTTVAIRVPLAYGLVYLTQTPEAPLGNSDMLFYSMLISWVIGMALSIIFYARGKWKDKSVVTRSAKNDLPAENIMEQEEEIGLD